MYHFLMEFLQTTLERLLVYRKSADYFVVQIMSDCFRSRMHTQDVALTPRNLYSSYLLHVLPVVEGYYTLRASTWYT